MSILVVTGDDIVTAVGKKSLVDLFGLIKAAYFSPEWASLGINSGAVYFWLIFHAITVYSILM